MLRKIVKAAKSPRLLYACHVEGIGTELFKAVCEHDAEGIVAKRRNGVYSIRDRWLKIRNRNYSQLHGRHELFETFRSPQRVTTKTKTKVKKESS
jgi:ATP-dependent DNA ligase